MNTPTVRSLLPVLLLALTACAPATSTAANPNALNDTGPGPEGSPLKLGQTWTVHYTTTQGQKGTFSVTTRKRTVNADQTVVYSDQITANKALAVMFSKRDDQSTGLSATETLLERVKINGMNMCIVSNPDPSSTTFTGEYAYIDFNTSNDPYSKKGTCTLTLQR